MIPCIALLCQRPSESVRGALIPTVLVHFKNSCTHPALRVSPSASVRFAVEGRSTVRRAFRFFLHRTVLREASSSVRASRRSLLSFPWDGFPKVERPDRKVCVFLNLIRSVRLLSPKAVVFTVPAATHFCKSFITEDLRAVTRLSAARAALETAVRRSGDLGNGDQDNESPAQGGRLGWVYLWVCSFSPPAFHKKSTSKINK